MSLQNDDLPARNGAVLTQLWNSSRVFKKPNGTEAVGLRIRSRLYVSVALDGVVWWREEFGGFMGVYPPPLEIRNGMQNLCSYVPPKADYDSERAHPH